MRLGAREQCQQITHLRLCRPTDLGREGLAVPKRKPLALTDEVVKEENCATESKQK